MPGNTLSALVGLRFASPYALFRSTSVPPKVSAWATQHGRSVGPLGRWRQRIILSGVLIPAALSGCQAGFGSRAGPNPVVAIERLWTEKAPDDNGFMEIRLGEARIALASDGCSQKMISKLVCRNARVTVSIGHLPQQTLLLPEVWLPASPSSNGAVRTDFRGSSRFAFADDLYGIILSDISADGYEDLVVWSGADGNYGDPSYAYYLYDAKTQRLIENAHLAKLMQSHSISRLVDGRLVAWYRSGPCDRGEKLVGIRGNGAEILASRDYTTCGEHALDGERISDDSWIRLEGERSQ